MSADRALRAAGALVALAGLAVATYLTIVHARGIEPVCAISHGCSVVQSSDWSALAGVPVAYLGLAGYAAILLGLAVDTPRAREATALIALVGFGFSAWLTYVEVFELRAICVWCVASAICLTLLALLTAGRLASPPRRDDRLEG